MMKKASVLILFAFLCLKVQSAKVESKNLHDEAYLIDAANGHHLLMIRLQMNEAYKPTEADLNHALLSLIADQKIKSYPARYKTVICFVDSIYECDMRTNSMLSKSTTDIMPTFLRSCDCQRDVSQKWQSYKHWKDGLLIFALNLYAKNAMPLIILL